MEMTNKMSKAERDVTLLPQQRPGLSLDHRAQEDDGADTGATSTQAPRLGGSRSVQDQSQTN